MVELLEVPSGSAHARAKRRDFPALFAESLEL
jgi:hypothetical protein